MKGQNSKRERKTEIVNGGGLGGSHSSRYVGRSHKRASQRKGPQVGATAAARTKRRLSEVHRQGETVQQRA